HDDTREEAKVYKPSSSSRAFGMPGADMGVGVGFKPLQLNAELKENEKVNGSGQQGSTTSTSTTTTTTTTMTAITAITATTTTTTTTVTTEQRAQRWEGPLSRFTTYTSVKDPKACLRAIEQSLHKMEKNKLVDWEVKGYNVFGRMYDGLEMSEYMINVYISGETEQFQSVIEVRRASGDAFVHDKFFCQILNLLGEEDIVERKTDSHNELNEDEDEDACNNIETGAFGIGLAGLSSLQPLSLSPDDLAAIDADLLNELASSKDIVSDDDTVFSEVTESTMTTTTTTTTTSAQQLADELIEVVTDKDSFQEVLRHSSGVLVQELQSNTPLLDYVVTQKDIIERLIKPLTGDFYDTLIVNFFFFFFLLLPFFFK
ncbi:hypothetical protein RFI_14109, partial [Reticulomyxa filosa]